MKPTHFQIEFKNERIIPSGGLSLVGCILEKSGFIVSPVHGMERPFILDPPGVIFPILVPMGRSIHLQSVLCMK